MTYTAKEVLDDIKDYITQNYNNDRILLHNINKKYLMQNIMEHDIYPFSKNMSLVTLPMDTKTTLCYMFLESLSKSDCTNFSFKTAILMFVILASTFKRSSEDSCDVNIQEINGKLYIYSTLECYNDNLRIIMNLTDTDDDIIMHVQSYDNKHKQFPVTSCATVKYIQQINIKNEYFTHNPLFPNFKYKKLAIISYLLSMIVCHKEDSSFSKYLEDSFDFVDNNPLYLLYNMYCIYRVYNYSRYDTRTEEKKLRPDVIDQKIKMKRVIQDGDPDTYQEIVTNNNKWFGFN